MTCLLTSSGFVCLYTIVSWGEWAAVCKPISGFWNKDLRAKCLPVKFHKGFALMNTCKSCLGYCYCTMSWRLTGRYIACNILTDICFASLPVPIILGLQMRQKTRIYLIFILSLGYMYVYSVHNCARKLITNQARWRWASSKLSFKTQREVIPISHCTSLIIHLHHKLPTNTCAVRTTSSSGAFSKSTPVS